ncbi:hypothetical protein JOH51_000700 [Rhizobium leguminosarum]|nr:hypothetical protein [Rhizobium leguminosarum]
MTGEILDDGTGLKVQSAVGIAARTFLIAPNIN